MGVVTRRQHKGPTLAFLIASCVKQKIFQGYSWYAYRNASVTRPQFIEPLHARPRVIYILFLLALSTQFQALSDKNNDIDYHNLDLNGYASFVQETSENGVSPFPQTLFLIFYRRRWGESRGTGLDWAGHGSVLVVSFIYIIMWIWNLW